MTNHNLNLRNILFLFVLIFAVIGLWASFVITLDKIELLKNPDYIPPCNINPLFSCKTVMNTEYAEMFGFPNTIIGLVGYTVMITVSVFMLFQGKVNRWLLIFANLGCLISFSFSYLLTWLSMYKIGALCPYCLLSCFAATNMFFTFLVVSLKDNIFNLKHDVNHKIQKLIDKKLYIPIIILWNVGVVLWIILKFPNVLFF